jgi:hypothetical protein
MKYVIKGAMRDTGEDVSIEVEANGAEEARQRANGMGLLVSECTSSKSDDGTKECPYCAERIQAKAIKCRFCGEMLNGHIDAGHSGLPEAEVPPAAESTPTPTRVTYDPSTDTFIGTMPLVVKLAMRAVQELGWKLENANETLGLVTFETGVTWGSWSGVSCSLNMEEVSRNHFRIKGTGKQNVRGGQLLAINLGGEAQGKAKKAIEKMKTLAR